MAVSGVYFAFLKKTIAAWVYMYWWTIFVHTFDYEFIKKNINQSSSGKVLRFNTMNHHWQIRISGLHGGLLS